MDCVGSPSFLWILCTNYACNALNQIAYDQLKGRTPIQCDFGYTPYVSAILCFPAINEFCFMKKIVFLSQLSGLEFFWHL